MNQSSSESNECDYANASSDADDDVVNKLSGNLVHLLPHTSITLQLFIVALDVNCFDISRRKRMSAFCLQGI